MHYDTELVRETADTAAVYASVSADVLLLGGSESPAYLRTAFDALERVLPHSRHVTLPGLGHTGPEDQPEPVAEQLRPFFADAQRTKPRLPSSSII